MVSTVMAICYNLLYYFMCYNCEDPFLGEKQRTNQSLLNFSCNEWKTRKMTFIFDLDLAIAHFMQ